MEDLLMGGLFALALILKTSASVNVNIKSTKNEHNLSPKLILVCVIGKLYGIWFVEDATLKMVLNLGLMILIMIPSSFMWVTSTVLSIFKSVLVFCSCIFIWAVNFAHQLAQVIIIKGLEYFHLLEPRYLAYFAMGLWAYDCLNAAFIAVLASLYKVERNHKRLMSQVILRVQHETTMEEPLTGNMFQVDLTLRHDKSCAVTLGAVQMMEMTETITKDESQEKKTIIERYANLKEFLYKELEIKGDEVNSLTGPHFYKEMEQRVKRWIGKNKVVCRDSELTKQKEEIEMRDKVIEELLDIPMSTRFDPPKAAPPPPPPQQPVDHSKCREKTKRVRAQLDEITKSRDHLSELLEKKQADYREEARGYKLKIKELHATVKTNKLETDRLQLKVKKVTDSMEKANQEKNKIKLQAEKQTKECKDKMKEFKRKINTVATKDARIAELEKQVANLRDKNDDDPGFRPECQICTDYYTVDHEPVSLKCGHVFGLTCITQWIRKKHTCPTCSQQTSVEDFLTLYL